MATDKYPEKPRTSHKPEGEPPGFIKSSGGVGAGHTQHDGRMPHPFGEACPMDESGEGTGN